LVLSERRRRRTLPPTAVAVIFVLLAPAAASAQSLSTRRAPAPQTSPGTLIGTIPPPSPTPPVRSPQPTQSSPGTLKAPSPAPSTPQPSPQQTPTGVISTGGTPSPSPSPSVLNLDQIYRGDDGSALYLRLAGTRVYGFAEHPGRHYALVLTGTLNGFVIKGSWWDVPKGKLRRRSAGKMELRWSQSGDRVVRSAGDDFGPDAWEKIEPFSFPWPGYEPPGFQDTQPSQLNGVFTGGDGSRHHIRHKGNDVVWIAERIGQPGERPTWATVFTGTRAPSGVVVGTFADVPKGTETRSGAFSVKEGPERGLTLSQPVRGRSKLLVPDYLMDFGLFGTQIDNALSGTAPNGSPKVVGFAYAIAKNGVIVARGAGGSRTLGVHGFISEPFTPNTQAQAASASKLVSAAAMMRTLHAHGISVDAKISPHLPSCWVKDAGISRVTFRSVLAHTGGFRSGDTTSCREDPYECLRTLIANGPSGRPGRYRYENVNFALLRMLVPLVEDRDDAQAIFEQADCENTGDRINKPVSEMFSRYVLKDMLEPVGVEAGFTPTTDDVAFVYDNWDRSVPGAGPRADFFERAGAGYLVISAVDYAQFLSALDGGQIVPKSVVATMKSGRLGFDGALSGTAGMYEWKNGACPGPLDRPIGARRAKANKVVDVDNSCRTSAMIFPGGVQAYVTINSGNNLYSGGTLEAILGNAFDAALR
jgi:CubicO group peptidase (beta-lactamase class C family)